MSNNLVIVESPAKCKTIEKYLGKEYKVLASYGHVRDLIRKDGAVDTENSHQMKFELIERNEKHVAKIIKALKKADTLYLATDQDREGEAISWHLDEILKERGLLKGKTVRRIVFNEITKSAIQKAISQPRDISQPLVDAYLARRILDYLVGFNLSPLLWKKITPGLSAGRVQSPALRMIVEREKEIEAFKPREYWSIEATLEASNINFASRLVEYKGNKVEQFSFESETAAFSVRDTVVTAAEGKLRVKVVNKKQRRRNPAAPFSTSTLQQEASRKLGFNARRTMMTAQKLYEGMDTGEGPVGLITYMRTDSVSLSDEAVVEIRELIAERYGKKNLPTEPNVYKSKSKNAQEAHEGVRPTSIMRTPEQVKSFLNEDQFKLYSLIWKRTVACQMVAAVFDTVAINMVPANDESAAIIRANGSILVEPGFIAVYQEGTDDVKDEEADKSLPAVAVDELVTLNEIQANQHFTEPPPRYSEASLVKTLEEYGIGRPSTYANIISTLLNREYAEMDGKRFMATDRGMIVGDFLIKHFSQYVDFRFTADFEDYLDEIARDENNYLAVLDNFWVPFKKRVDEKENLTREEVAQSRDLGTDPESGKPVSVRLGQYGAFAQIGTKDDEDKPKFAGLRPGQKINTITFDEAMHLFILPRTLGQTPEGETVTASVGRFGPYVKYDQTFVSTKDEDPYTIDLETALRFIADKKEFEANRIIQDFPEHEIQVLNGRFGPYISSLDKKNVKVPKDREPASMTVAECIALVEKAAFKPKKKTAKKKTAKKKAAKKKTAKKKTAKKKAAKKKAAKKKTTHKAAGPDS
ncbi:MAG: type I DNA topoisomerase [Gammaproteobacteria bacterium]|nr:type I DNA topoisomerase [Gammaproteobacteria bacterium]